eukprot:15464599-Alexandrium_andersonii.AAC.1
MAMGHSFPAAHRPFGQKAAASRSPPTGASGKSDLTGGGHRPPPDPARKRLQRAGGASQGGSGRW